MITKSAIDALEVLVKDALNAEEMDFVFSEAEYEEQLRIMYENGTKNVQDNLDRVISSCPKEVCEETRKRFLHNMVIVQDKLKNLQEKVKEASQGIAEGTGRENAQIEFCNKVLSFIENISTQLSNLSEEALSHADIQDTYFHIIKKNKDELVQIYNNLVQKRWIEGSDTSLGDFIHFFGGEGLKPRHPIKWNKSLSMLAAFIDLMVDDRNDLSKAAKIFTICDDKDTNYHPFTRDSLKASRYRALNSEDWTFFNYQETIKKEIFGIEPNS